MKELSKNSVQVVVTSPPYNVRKPYQGFKDSLEYSKYLDVIRRVFVEVFRVLKSSGVVFLNIANCAKNPYKAFNLAYLLKDIGFCLVDSIIWYKPKPRYLNTNRFLTNAYEFVFMFAKTKNYYFDKLAIGVPCSTKPGLKCRTNVWSINKVCKNQYIGWKHCAMFPEKLPELCLRLCSKPGDLVLDPFVGSGTSAVVAKRLGRRFIGYDVSDEYVRMSRERLKKTFKGVEKHEDLDDCLGGFASTFSAG